MEKAMIRYLSHLIAALIAVGCFYLLYYLQTRHPKIHHGFWKTLGEAIPLTPRLLHGLSIGMVAGFLLLTALEYVTQGAWLETYNPFINPFIAGVFTGIMLSGWVAIVIILRRRYQALRRKDQS